MNRNSLLLNNSENVFQVSFCPKLANNTKTENSNDNIEFSFDLFMPNQTIFLYDENDQNEYRLVNCWHSGEYEKEDLNINRDTDNGIVAWGNWESDQAKTLPIDKSDENSKFQSEVSKPTNIKKKFVQSLPVVRYFTHPEENKLNIFTYKESETKFSFSVLSKFKIKGVKNNPDPRIFSKDFISFNSKKDLTKPIITLKCKFCLNSDHLSKDCSAELQTDEFCYICLAKDHEMRNCPLKQCKRCNRIGHLTSDCPTTKQIQKCSQCRHIGHLSEDCLLNPLPISSFILETTICSFCKTKGHFICPVKFSYVDDYFEEEVKVSSDDSEKTELGWGKIDNNIDPFREDINSRNINWKSCPKCAGSHLMKECSKLNKYHRDDEIRSKNAKSFFYIGPSTLCKDKNFMGDSFSD